MVKFEDILKLEQKDAKELVDTLLLVKDKNETNIYFALCERIGSIQGQKILITPIKMLVQLPDILGKQFWVDKDQCYLYNGSIDLSN